MTVFHSFHLDELTSSFNSSFIESDITPTKPALHLFSFRRLLTANLLKKNSMRTDNYKNALINALMTETNLVNRVQIVHNI